jgi:C1A family cysteine protease
MQKLRAILCFLAILLTMGTTGCSQLLHELTYPLGSAGTAEVSPSPAKQSFTTKPKPSAKIASPTASAKASASKTKAPLPADGKLPEKFDLRTMGGVTPVHDQKSQDTCWDFAAIAAAESSAAYLSGIKADFSENNMKYALSSDGGNKWGFNRAFDGGGNREMAAAYFARRSGAVLEANDPNTFKNEKRPAKVTNSKKASYIVGDILYLPVSVGEKHNVADTSDINIIKNAMLKYGGIFTDYQHDFDLYSTKYKSYYMPDKGKKLSGFAHAVVLVGWDDNYKASKFKEKPPGNGAWIAKNSFGTTFGDKGYFYISYYDALIGSGATAFTGVTKAPLSMRAYQYDPFGNNCYFTANVSKIYGANVFDRDEFGGASGKESVKQIGLFTSQPNVTATILLGSGDESGDPAAFKLTKVQTVTLEYAGYHTITLDTPYLLKERYLCVAAEFSAEGQNVKIAMEDQTDVTRQAEASAGQSFTSWDGENWTDVTIKEKNTNLCIKAFSVTVK